MTRIANYCARCGSALIRKEAYGRERPVCPECNFVVFHDPKVAVLAFIEENEKVLLVKRAIDPGRGKWACPAGFVEHDEDPADAVIREVNEETGLIVWIEEILEIFPKKDEGLADIVIAYRVSIEGGQIQAADDAEEVGWFGRDELPELVFYPSLTLVGKRWYNGEL